MGQIATSEPGTRQLNSLELRDRVVAGTQPRKSSPSFSGTTIPALMIHYTAMVQIFGSENALHHLTEDETERLASLYEGAMASLAAVPDPASTQVCLGVSPATHP